MGWLFNLLLIFLVLSIVPKLFGRLRVWLLVKEIAIREPVLDVIQLEDIPSRFRPIFEYGRKQMESELPFHFRGTIRQKQELPDSLVKWFGLFVNYDGRVLASVGTNYVPSNEPFSVTFSSITNDGQRLETVNWISHLQLESGSDIVDAYADDLATHYQRHLERLDKLPSGSIVDLTNYSTYDLMELENSEVIQQHEMLLNSGMIRELGNGVFKLTLGAGWRLTQKIIDGEKSINTVRLGQAESIEAEVIEYGVIEDETIDEPQSLEAIPVLSAEADVADFERQRESALAVASRRSLVTKWVILFLSAVAFFITFGFWLGFDLSALLLAVVFVHEVGHISAMALFGYRNRQVLFIPFFGAAAIGEKNEAPAWQQLVVLFMGPIPGIVFGIGCLFYALFRLQSGEIIMERDSLFERVVSLTLVLNYLNLIPLGFLDGGKIVQILFFSRFVRARFFFQVFSSLAFTAFAILLQSWILGVIAVISFLALPSLWRFGTLLKNLESLFDRTYLPELDSQQERRLEVFRTLRRPPYLHWGSRDRHETARQLIEYVETSRAGLPTIIIGTTAYILSIALPIAAFVLWVALREGIPQ